MIDYLKEFYNEEFRGYDSLDLEDLIFNYKENCKNYFKNNGYPDELRDYFEFLRLIHYRNNVLWISIHEKFKFSTRDKFDNLTSLFYDYQFILTVLQNNLQVLHKILSEGFEYQSVLILRNHLELLELTLSIFGDENQYKLYKEVIQSKEGESNRTMKFSTTQKVNNKILNPYKGKPGYEYYKGFYDDFKDIKSKYYDKFSSVSHPNRTNVILGAYALTEDEYLECNIGGKIGMSTKNILEDLIHIEMLSFNSILTIQIELHKMSFNKYGENSSKLTFLVTSAWSIYNNKLKSLM